MQIRIATNKIKILEHVIQLKEAASSNLYSDIDSYTLCVEAYKHIEFKHHAAR